VFSAVATAVAAAAFWPTYRTGDLVLMVVVTIVLGVAIGLVGALFRASTTVVAGTSVVVFIVFGVPLAVPSEAIAHVLPSVRGLVDLVVSVALGWKQLVTVSAPVGSYAALLVPAYLAVLAVAVTTTTIALRAHRRAFAVLPPLVLFVVAIVLGPSRVDAVPQLALALALVVVTVGWLMVVRSSGDRAALRELADAPIASVHGLRAARGGAAALAVLVAATMLGGAAAVALPAAAPRQVARTVTQPPFDPRDYPSPLSAFRSYLEEPKASEPMITVTGLGSQRRVRIATLDTYDGVVYAVSPGGSGTFARTPYRIERKQAGGQSVSLGVKVDDYSGVWVPDAGMLGRLRFTGPRASTLGADFFYNDVTGTAAVLGGVRSGDSYRIDASAAPERSISSLKQAEPGHATLPAVGVMPDGVKDTIQQYAPNGASAGQALAAALDGLAANGYVSHGIGAKEPASRSGHGADRITELLTTVPMIGDQEQYAVAAALMARDLGFPARVVLGFVVPDGRSTTGAVTLTGDDISAWIQVQTKADGWVTIDPNPPVRPVPQKQPDEPKQVSRPQSVVPPPPADPDQDLSQPPAPHVASDTPRAQPVWLTVLLIIAQVLGWMLLAAALLAAPFLAVIAAKWRRRARRRSAPTATERITAGWHEFADAAVDNGYRPPPSATRSELAQTVGGMRPRVLAAVADRAVFGPAVPSATDADQVWRAVDELRSALRAGKTKRQRIRAAVSLRSLTGYRENRRGGSQSR